MISRLLRFLFGKPGSKRQTAAGVGTGVFLTMAVAFIGGWEGLRTTAYQDIVGVWTVCYGETRGVAQGDSYTVEECDQMLAEEIVAFDAALSRCIPALPSFPTQTRVAFVSWAYNVGTGAACRSTLARKANAGDLVGACNELRRWNRAGGRIIRGLTNRRLSERELCLAGVNP